MTTGIEQTFATASQLHQAGRLAEAERGYRQVLAQQPDHAGALHFLGLLAAQAGQPAAAADLIARALRRQPAWAEGHSNLGDVLRTLGRLADAEAACRRAIVLNPRLAEAHNNLGLTLQQAGNLGEAIAAFQKAAALNERFAQAHFNLGASHQANQQMEEALSAYQTAIQTRQEFPEALANMSVVLLALGRNKAAVEAAQRAATLRPESASMHFNLGTALLATARPEEAATALTRATSLRPTYSEAWAQLGIALQELERLDEAVAAHQTAIAINPRLSAAHNNLGLALAAQGRHSEALEAHRTAVSLDPTDAGAHRNLGWRLLADGRLKEGWDEYEWRWRCADFQTPRLVATPLWDGGPLEGRRLLLHAEQGFGDTLQFLRYVPLLPGKDGQVILELPSALARLVGMQEWRCRLVTTEEGLPPAEVQCPLASLPRVFGTELATIPGRVPYLRVDADLCRPWKERIGAVSGQMKVGLAWAGNVKFKGDRTRSITLAHLAPLAAAPGAAFFSLQKGEAARQALAPSAGLQVEDLSAVLRDFADTAAAMMALDLIITTDTSVAHLAGALGRPTWVMLQFNPDWRWLRNRDDSPWYPTMRLFCQQARGDWAAVVARVAAQLGSLRQ